MAQSIAQYDRSSPAFGFAAQGKSVGASLLQKIQSLQNSLQNSSVAIEGSQLRVTLKDSYLSPVVPMIVRAVQKDPELKDGIFFIDRGLSRSYNDVVWHLEDRGLKLARKIYREQAEGSEQLTRVVITPASLGRDLKKRNHLRLVDLEFADKLGREVRMVSEIVMPPIHPEKRSASQKYIVQTRDISLGTSFEKLGPAEPLCLQVTPLGPLGFLHWEP